jgi:nucleotide-binding universal stress UspA family protein
MFQRLLLAWDGSPPARRALDLAIDLARRYGAEIVAVSVAHSPAHAETEEDRRESVEAARRFLEQSFLAVRDRASRAGVPVEQVILESEAREPADDLIRYAHEHGFDLVVAGHHRGRRRPGRLVLRDLADRLVAHADLPVLLVQDRADERWPG